MSELKQHDLGFWQLAKIPTIEELSNFYRDKYFEKEDGSNHYAYRYDDRDLAHKQIAPSEMEYVFGKLKKKLIDIGCGEGFALNHFKKLGWQVHGVDFTLKALLDFHPNLANDVIETDAFAYIDTLIQEKKTFDVVVCNHVLEHVVDPISLLEKISKIVEKGGHFRVSVPNDTSWLQDYIVEKSYAQKNFYLAVPDHISYFNCETLVKTVQSHEFELTEILTEFPVDLFVLNGASNYISDKSKGRAAHWARTEFELALFRQGIDKLIEFRRGCARAGIGRAINAYFVRK